MKGRLVCIEYILKVGRFVCAEVRFDLLSNFLFERIKFLRGKEFAKGNAQTVADELDCNEFGISALTV